MTKLFQVSSFFVTNKQKPWKYPPKSLKIPPNLEKSYSFLKVREALKIPKKVQIFVARPMSAVVFTIDLNNMNSIWPKTEDCEERETYVICFEKYPHQKLLRLASTWPLTIAVSLAFVLKPAVHYLRSCNSCSPKILKAASGHLKA